MLKASQTFTIVLVHNVVVDLATFTLQRYTYNFQIAGIFLKIDPAGFPTLRLTPAE